MARANVVPLEVVERYANRDFKGALMLADRKPGATEVRNLYEAQQIMLGTYRAAFSFCEQKIGLCRHLSVSSHMKGKVPGLEVMAMVCQAFDMTGIPLRRPGRIWTEEFEPGHMAVNIIELDT